MWKRQVEDSAEKQRRICQKWGADYAPVDSAQKVGIAKDVQAAGYPINGLRHPPEGDASGWFIWAGEKMDTADDYFLPLHIEHLGEWCPAVTEYLGLGPGWRFLIAPDYEDVWCDPSLLNICSSRGMAAEMFSSPRPRARAAPGTPPIAAESGIGPSRRAPAAREEIRFQLSLE